MSSAEVVRACPRCGGKSYGGSSKPRVKDGLVYRRRICTAAGCGISWITVEGTFYENARLAEALGWYHDGGPK